MAMAVKLEKRLNPSAAMNVIVPVLSIIAAFLVGAMFLTLTDRDPLEVYTAMFKGALGKPRAFGNTLAKTVTLCLTGLAMSLAAKAGIFNVGGEGQLYL